MCNFSDSCTSPWLQQPIFWYSAIFLKVTGNIKDFYSQQRDKNKVLTDKTKNICHGSHFHFHIASIFM